MGQKKRFEECYVIFKQGLYSSCLTILTTILEGFISTFGNAPKDVRIMKICNFHVEEERNRGNKVKSLCWQSMYEYTKLLFEKSDETPGVKGLGILPGEILRIPDKEGIKIPHMGWNSVKIKENAKIFKDVPQDSYVYFVHSYYLKAGREEDVAATTEYSTLIHVAVEHDNVFACQFHPEKSSEIGLKILKNFVEL